MGFIEDAFTLDTGKAIKFSQPLDILFGFDNGMMRDYPKHMKELQSNPTSICHRCVSAQPLWSYKTIMQLYYKSENLKARARVFLYKDGM